MKPKFWRLQVNGSLSVDDAQAAVAESEGTLLRLDTGEGKTDIYFSSASGARKLKAGSLKEVTLAEVTKLR
jgi:hypothetical protein